MYVLSAVDHLFVETTHLAPSSTQRLGSSKVFAVFLIKAEIWMCLCQFEKHIIYHDILPKVDVLNTIKEINYFEQICHVFLFSRKLLYFILDKENQ